MSKHAPKCHILVLDDEEGTRNILEKMLFQAGFSVSVVATGKQALQRILSKKQHYDLIVSDIRMPLMSGIELMRELQDLNVKIPAIFISGSPSRSHIAKLKELGIENIFVKPFKLNQLIERIREVLGRSAEEEKTGAAA